jgi:hypothetical protein
VALARQLLEQWQFLWNPLARPLTALVSLLCWGIASLQDTHGLGL